MMRTQPGENNHILQITPVVIGHEQTLLPSDLPESTVLSVRKTEKDAEGIIVWSVMRGVSQTNDVAVSKVLLEFNPSSDTIIQLVLEQKTKRGRPVCLASQSVTHAGSLALEVLDTFPQRFVSIALVGIAVDLPRPRQIGVRNS